MPERDHPETRAQIKREKRLRRAQRRAERHAQRREITPIKPIRTHIAPGIKSLYLGLAGADIFSRLYNVHRVELSLFLSPPQTIYWRLKVPSQCERLRDEG